MPTHDSVRSSSRLSRSHSTLASGASGSARCAATATMHVLTTAKSTAHPTAVITTDGRVSQACEPFKVTDTASGVAAWNMIDVAAPASPSAAELNTRRYTGIRRALRYRTPPTTNGASRAYSGGSSSAIG